ncbi:MAG: ATP-binding cassette domain-containing protein [Rothia sp. (in: high G+C Gram-positive bacteria)]|nr:ATP-binding cassette domain-containing protein [Rothia sp. (in: high G+C Gram-positive bacteria)]
MRTDALVSTHNIRQEFGSPQEPLEILHGIDLEIYPGEVVALLGTSGSGKSTLLNILGLLAQPADGSYYLDQHKVSQLSAAERAHIRLDKIGFVFQSFHLINHKNVLENVELPLLYQGVAKAERRQRALAIIDQLGLTHRQKAKVETLSGGEQQRVAIGRALVTNPQLLLCDEPTGALDQKRSAEVMDLLRQLTGRDRATLIVTHDPAIAARCDRSLLIEDGKLLEQGGKADQQVNSQEAPLEREPYQRSRSKHPWIKVAVLEALGATFARLRRNLFTMLGVALGVAALTLTIGLSATISGQISDAFDIYQAKKITLKYNGSSQITGVEAQTILESPSYRNLEGLNGVKQVAAYRILSEGAQLQTSLAAEGGRSVPLIASQDSIFEVQEQELVYGRLFDQGHNSRQEAVAVIGQGTFRALGLEWKPGLTLYLDGQPLTIVGVVSENPAAGGYYGAIYLPLQALNDKSASSFEIALAVEPGAALQVGKEAPYALSPQAPGDYSATVPPAPEGLKETISEQQEKLLLAMALITLVIGTVGTMNTFLVGVMERRQEIGLRLALGVRPSGITLQLALETVITSLLGALAGLLISINAIALVSLINSWNPIISPVMVGLGVGVGLLMGLLAGIYPAWKASGIDPIESLTRL